MLTSKEYLDCVKAFQETNPQIGDLVWCCHHEILIEPLSEPWETRLAYIIENKPQEEIANRLLSFRPVKTPVNSDLNKAYSDYDKVCSDLNKARSDLNKAYSDYDKVCSDLNKVYSDYDKARSDLNKVRSDLNKVYSDYDKARSDLNKACLRNQKELEQQFHNEWTENKWNGSKVEGT